MKVFGTAVPLLSAFAAGALAAPALVDRSNLQEQIGSQHPHSTTYKIPTRYESTVLGRRLLALSSTGVLSTIFPQHVTYPRVPTAVGSAPIGLPDYIASCEEPSGNPTLLALTISTSTRNAVAGSNVSMSLSWWDQYTKLTNKEPFSSANLPRLSMIGYLEEIPLKEAQENGVVECFIGAHKDSQIWMPGNPDSPHDGKWMRMVVQQVYWIGGFGDQAYIGWFDPDEWHNVSTEEWEAVRLQGESA